MSNHPINTLPRVSSGRYYVYSPMRRQHSTFESIVYYHAYHTPLLTLTTSVTENGSFGNIRFVTLSV